MRIALLAFLLIAGPALAQDAPMLPTYGHPFMALPIENGVVVSVTSNGQQGSATGLRVFTGASATRLTPRCFQPLGTAQVMDVAATPNGKGLVVAAGDAGLVLLDRSAVVEGCHAKGVAVSLGSAASRQGSIGVTMTSDGQFAFVANEYGVAARDANGQDIKGNVGVVALSYDPAGTPIGGKLVGRIATGGAAVTSVTLSPDGHRLYVTSEIARSGARVANAQLPVLAHGGCRQGDGPAQAFGLLSVIDVAKAEAGTTDAVVAASAAGCSPVRAAVSPDGQTIWVAARGDNKVIAFAAGSLESDPAHSFLGIGDSGGEAPVGLALFAGGKRLAVANSNRFGGKEAVGNLALLDAVPNEPKVTETVPATNFPRSVSVAQDDRTLFLTDYNGGRVQVVNR